MDVLPLLWFDTSHQQTMTVSFEAAPRCKESCEPILCVSHAFLHLAVLFDFPQQGDSGFASSLNK